MLGGAGLGPRLTLGFMLVEHLGLPPHLRLSTWRLEATLRTTEGCLSWGCIKKPTQAGLPRKERP